MHQVKRTMYRPMLHHFLDEACCAKTAWVTPGELICQVHADTCLSVLPVSTCERQQLSSWVGYVLAPNLLTDETERKLLTTVCPVTVTIITYIERSASFGQETVIRGDGVISYYSMLWWKRSVFGLFLKAGNDSESLRSSGRLFQTCLLYTSPSPRD